MSIDMVEAVSQGNSCRVKDNIAGEMGSFTPVTSVAYDRERFFFLTRFFDTFDLDAGWELSCPFNEGRGDDV